MPESSPRPPRLARRLARWRLPDEVADALVGDLEETWATRVRPARGPFVAALWFWWQALTVRRGRLRRAARSLRAVRPTRETRRPRRAGRTDLDPASTLAMTVHDLRYALRRLLKSPGFTLVAVLSLALGIGANTAMFSVVNSVLLRELPIEDPDQVVEVYTSDSDGFPHATSSFPDYRDMREEVGAFEGVVATRTVLARMERGGEPELLFGEVVSGDYFRVLGVDMELGRSFLPEEDATPGTHPVVVLGYRAWEDDFGADPEVLGSDVRLNGRLYTVVGVAPEAFSGSVPVVSTGFYAPLMMTAPLMEWDGGVGGLLERRGSRNMFVKARLASGVTVEQANAELAAFAAGLAEAHPETNENRSMTALPTGDVALHPYVDKILTPVAGLLLAVVGLVLLIACVNLASFLLARAEDRRKEIAVRLALGAGRGALIRQLLVETTLLAALGGAAGLLAAQWTLGLLRTFQPPLPIPVDFVVELDGTVLAFTAGVSLLAGLFFGLFPALQATDPDVAPVLKDEGRGVATGSRLRNVLVMAQVAFSFVLLIGAGLFVRSLQKAQAIDPGFDTGPAAVVWPMPGMSGYGSAEATDVLYGALEDQLLAHPDIRAVAMADRLPLGSQIMTRGILVPGMPSEHPEGIWEVDYTNVRPGYFEAMDVAIQRGRTLRETDLEGERVAVVSEAFARRFFPDEGAVGSSFDHTGGQRVRIVGVAADTKVRSLGEAPRPYVYEPARTEMGLGLQLVIKGEGTSAELLNATLGVLDEVDPNLVLFEAKTMNEHLALMLFPPRMAALLLGVFGGLALVLSAVGIYGVVSHSVSRRTRELGIRMSLGATAGDVVRMAVGGGMRLVVVGGLGGTVLAVGLTWAIADFLYGISARDVGTFVAIPVLLGAVALVAAWVPARGASRVDPVRALRSE